MPPPFLTPSGAIARRGPCSERVRGGRRCAAARRRGSQGVHAGDLPLRNPNAPQTVPKTPLENLNKTSLCDPLRSPIAPQTVPKTPLENTQTHSTLRPPPKLNCPADRAQNPLENTQKHSTLRPIRSPTEKQTVRNPQKFSTLLRRPCPKPGNSSERNIQKTTQ